MSTLVRSCALSFTVVLFEVLTAGAARADRVVVLRPSGDLPPERLDRIEEQIGDAVRALGLDAVSEHRPPGTPPAEPPVTGNEMRAVAEVQNAQWVVYTRANIATATEQRVLFRVGYAPQTRVEEFEAKVRVGNEPARFKAVLAAMLRPEGMGEDAAKLVDDTTPQTPSTPPAPTPEDTPPSPPPSKPEAPNEPTRAEPRPWFLQVGLGVLPILSHESDRRGGTFINVELRAGRELPFLPGLAVRLGADIVSSATGAFALHVGASYALNPFAVPLSVGAHVEGGWFQATTGERDASFLLRAGGLFAWRFSPMWSVELDAPAVAWLTAYGGVVSLGAAARVGVHF